MLISIIIPTRERAEYLKASLATCVAIADPDIEIVVSDNASQDETRAVVASFPDPRIVYVNTGRRISMRQNFNHGIAKSRGDYVIMIGDDDGMLPGQFPALRRIVEEFRPNVFSWRLVMYAWPGGGRHGHVRLKKEFTFGPPTVTNTEVLRRDFLQGRFLTSGGPRLYHGCVSRAMLERMRAKTGDYLKASSPDTYFEFFAVFAEEDYVFAEHPFSIGGHGSKSNGGASRYNASDSRARPRLQFAAEAASDPVREAIPGPYPTMMAGLFAMLETVRRDWSGDCEIRPDYRAWYRQVLSADRHRPEAHAVAAEMMRAYAASSGTDADFRNALDDLGSTPAGVTHAARRILKNLKIDWRLTLSGRDNSQNTVATAAVVIDRVLGAEYLAHTAQSRARLWRSARWRAIAGAFGLSRASPTPRSALAPQPAGHLPARD